MLAAALLAALGGCGQKGPLTLPDQPRTAVPAGAAGAPASAPPGATAGTQPGNDDGKTRDDQQKR